MPTIWRLAGICIQVGFFGGIVVGIGVSLYHLLRQIRRMNRHNKTKEN